MSFFPSRSRAPKWNGSWRSWDESRAVITPPLRTSVSKSMRVELHYSSLFITEYFISSYHSLTSNLNSLKTWLNIKQSLPLYRVYCAYIKSLHRLLPHWQNISEFFFLVCLTESTKQCIHSDNVFFISYTVCIPKWISLAFCVNVLIQRSWLSAAITLLGSIRIHLGPLIM